MTSRPTYYPRMDTEDRRVSTLIDDANELVKQIREQLDQYDEEPVKSTKRVSKLPDAFEIEILEKVQPHWKDTLDRIDSAITESEGTGPTFSSIKEDVSSSSVIMNLEEQRLVESLGVMSDEIDSFIEWIQGALPAFPKAERELKPILEAMDQSLNDIIREARWTLEDIHRRRQY